MAQVKSRNWIVTWYPDEANTAQPDDATQVAQHELLGDHFKVRIIQYKLNIKTDGALIFWAGQLEECPDTKRLHYHFLFHFKFPVRLAKVKALFPDDTAHAEIVKSIIDSYKYVTKEDSRFRGPWQGGEMPHMLDKATSGDKPPKKPKTCELILAAVKANTPIETLVQEVPTVLSMRKAYDWAKEMTQAKLSHRQGVQVHVIFGETNVGKTHTAYHYFAAGHMEQVGLVTCPQHSTTTWWFDQWDGEPILLIDDFNDRNVNADFFKHVLHEWPLKLPIKGGFRWATWTTVVITTNKRMEEWFNGEPLGDRQAIWRRITSLHEMEARGMWRELCVDYERPQDIGRPIAGDEGDYHPIPYPIPESP